MQDRCIISLDRRCFDATSFVDSHPGGRDNLRRYRGRDATEAFDIFGHSRGAHEFMRKRLMVFCSATFCGKRGRPLIDRYCHHRRQHGKLHTSNLLITLLLNGDARAVLVIGIIFSLFALVTYHCVAAAVWFLVAGRVVVSLFGRSTRGGFNTLWHKLSDSSMHMHIMTRFADKAGPREDDDFLEPSSSEDEASTGHGTTRRKRRGTPLSRKQRLLQHIENDFGVAGPSGNYGPCLLLLSLAIAALLHVIFRSGALWVWVL